MKKTNNIKTTLKRAVILCIFDGWGWREAASDNAITQANTPNWDYLLTNSPRTLLDASGAAVGLPEAQMGNSEVGHLTIGAGRIVKQLLGRVDDAIDQDSLGDGDGLQDFMKQVQNDTRRVGSKAQVHLVGLLSDGGVHSHLDHAIAIANILTNEGFEVLLHAITDGRDTAFKTARKYLNKFSEQAPLAKIVTLSGRYWAMDRASNLDRTKKAVEVMASGKGLHFANVGEAIQAAGKRGETDEFFTPSAIGDYKGIEPGSGLICFNFRPDRMRQLLLAFTCDGGQLSSKVHIDLSARLGMVSYSPQLDMHYRVLFDSQKIENTLGEIVSNLGLKQFRITETEKQAHVTYFLNGGIEEAFPNETRKILPSAKVLTHDLKPEMLAVEICDHLVEAILEKKYDLYIVNFANADMIGHTGNFDAALRSVEVLDECLGRLMQAIRVTGDVAMLLSADHGNIEHMHDIKSGRPITSHSTNPVPAVLYNLDDWISTTNTSIGGGLCDIAPTILTMMGLEVPKQMTGRTLFRCDS